MTVKRNHNILEGIADVLSSADLRELGVVEDKSIGRAGKSVYEKVNDLLIAEIEKGIIPWRKEWSGSNNNGTGQFMNFRTKRNYTGINPWLISLRIQPHHCPYFLTIAQIKNRGGELKPGASKFNVVYFGSAYKTKTVDPTPEKPEGDTYLRLIRFLKEYTVYNINDTTLEIDWKTIKPKLSEAQKIENCEKVYEMMPKRPGLKHGGDRAYYQPSADFVQMPKIEDFKKEPFYYTTLFHELIHSTGHAKRLKRDFGIMFGDNKYAFEELIAEIGASYLCAHTGILFHTKKNSAAYLQSWSKKLVLEAKQNKSFFFKAASKSQQAANFILSKQLEANKKSKKKSLQGVSLKTDIKKLKAKVAKLQGLGRSHKGYRNFEPHTLTDHVAEYLHGRRVLPESFKKFGDRNHLIGKSGNLYRLHWFGDKGITKALPLDKLAYDFQNEVPQYGFHDESEIISEMIEVISNYPTGAGAYMDDRNLERQYDQERELEQDREAETAAIAVKKVSKKKIKMIVSKKTATKGREKLIPAKRIFSIELSIIKSFINLDGKTVEQDSLANQLSKLSKAKKGGQLSNHRSIIIEIGNKLHKALHFALESPENRIQINLEPDFKKKCQGTIKGAQVKVRTEYLAGNRKKDKIETNETIDGVGFTKRPLYASTKTKVTDKKKKKTSRLGK